MSLSNINSNLWSTSLPVTTTDFSISSTVSDTNFSVSLLDEAQRNLSAGITKFSNLKEVDYTTEEDSFTESILQKIRNVTTSIIDTISSTVRSTIVETTTEDRAVAFLSTTETQKTFSEDLNVEERSGIDLSTVQTEEDSTTKQEVTSAFRIYSSEDVTSATTDQSEEESTAIQSTTAFQSSSSEDVGTEDGFSMTTQNTTNGVTRLQLKNSINTPVLIGEIVLTGAIASVVTCVYRKTRKQRAVTVPPRQDQGRDVEMNLLKKN